MLTPHQKEQLQANFKQNQAFFQSYQQELGQKRTLRTQSLEFAAKMPRLKDKEGNLPNVSVEQIIGEADKVYAYLTQDGDLDSLAQKPAVQLP